MDIQHLYKLFYKYQIKTGIFYSNQIMKFIKYLLVVVIG